MSPTDRHTARTAGQGARPAARPDSRRPPARGGGPRRPVRAPRWNRRLRVAVGIAVAVVVLGALAGVALGSSMFAVTGVTVAGAAPETTGAVHDAADVPDGVNLLLLDTSAVAGRVLEIPRVATVDVRRSLPGTVVVTVTEREPVLAAPVAGGVALVDATGFAYRAVATRPPGVPLLHLNPGVAPGPSEPATRAAVAVVTSLPPALRRTVTDVTATGPFDVSFALAGGRQVRWGADADDARKAAVLGPLLTRPGHVYDVSTPDLAVVS